MYSFSPGLATMSRRSGRADLAATPEIPLAYPVALNDADLADFISHWILMIKGDPIFNQKVNYWIMGVGAAEKKPRWSILRNVIGWGVEKKEKNASGHKGVGK